MLAPRHHHLLVIAACLGSVACERPHDVEPAAAGNTVAAPSRRTLRELSLKLAYERAKLERRFNQSVTLPTKRVAKHCPDSDITRQANDTTSRTLVVRSDDARREAKSLLPLQLLSPLKSDEFHELQHLLVAASGQAGALPQLDSVASFENARAKLEGLSRRRYQARFVVTDYREPRLIYKLTKNRREWVAGMLTTRLVVFEIDTEQPMCEATVRTGNDTSDVPTSLRSQEVTRSLLIRQLGDRLKEQAIEALSQMTSALSFPEAWSSRTHSPGN